MCKENLKRKRKPRERKGKTSMVTPRALAEGGAWRTGLFPDGPARRACTLSPHRGAFSCRLPFPFPFASPFHLPSGPRRPALGAHLAFRTPGESPPEPRVIVMLDLNQRVTHKTLGLREGSPGLALAERRPWRGEGAGGGSGSGADAQALVSSRWGRPWAALQAPGNSSWVF